MKKLTLTLTFALALAMSAMAQPNGGGLFQRGESYETGNGRGTDSPMLPIHGQTDNQDGNDSPLVGGMGLLFGMAVIYLTRKKDHLD